jgi:alpha-D-xyloside xylohydrolase
MIRQKLIHLLRSSAAVLLPLLPGVLAIAQPPSKQADGIVLTMPAGLLKIQVLSETVVRIAFAKDASFFTRPALDVVPQPAPFRDWKLGGTADATTVSTARLQVVVDRRAGAVRFLDPAGNPIASEVPGGRVLEPAEVQGERTWHVQQRWGENAGESLYGLGQRQFNTLDIKGYDLDLWQRNTNIAVPFLVSSRGYGVLWENTSLTRFRRSAAVHGDSAGVPVRHRGRAGRPLGAADGWLRAGAVLLRLAVGLAAAGSSRSRR